jgi:polar amino acid transport system substrate-binding protein
MRIAGGFLGALFVLVAGTAQADTIRIRADEWFPYNGTPGAAEPGYMIELARTIAERNGHQIDYRLLTWDESVEATRNGSADCVVGALRADAPDFHFPALSWGKSSDAFFVMDRTAWRYRGLDDLAQVRLSVISGYEYTAAVQAYVDSAPPERLVKVENSRNALSKSLMLLVTGRVDVLVEDRNVATAKIARMGLTGRVVEAGVPGEPEDVFIACTPARPEGEAWAKMFGEGIDQMRRARELRPLLSRYGLDDWAD